MRGFPAVRVLRWALGNQPLEDPMNARSSLFVLCHASLLAILGMLADRLPTDVSVAIRLTGLLGGVVCASLGILALLKKTVRGWVISALVPVSFALLSGAVSLWLRAGAGPAVAPACVLTAMFALSVGLLAYLAYTAQLAREPEPRREASPAAANRR